MPPHLLPDLPYLPSLSLLQSLVASFPFSFLFATAQSTGSAPLPHQTRSSCVPIFSRSVITRGANTGYWSVTVTYAPLQIVQERTRIYLSCLFIVDIPQPDRTHSLELFACFRPLTPCHRRCRRRLTRMTSRKRESLVASKLVRRVSRCVGD